MGTIRKKFGTCLFRGENDDGDGKEDRKWEQNPLEKMEEEKLKHLEMRNLWRESGERAGRE